MGEGPPWSWEDLSADERREVKQRCLDALVGVTGPREKKLSAALLDLVVRHQHRRLPDAS